MSMFQTKESFFGEYDVQISGLFRLIGELHEKLGKKQYFLNQYLTSVFRTITSNAAFDTVDSGISAARNLRSLCHCAVRGEESSDPFFNTVKQQLEAHPMDFQESVTKVHVLYLSLYDQYLSSLIPQFVEDQKQVITEFWDDIDVADWYHRIVEILGSEEPMQRLNRMIEEQLLISPILSCFLLGSRDDLLYTLLGRDLETDHHIFRVFVDFLQSKQT